MNNRKGHNSILFLTTLGVYLGLVIVGASPVAGHAALTRNFDIQEEVEFNDDLDTKPDPSIEELVSSFETYFNGVRDFVKDLKKLQSIEKFDPNFDTFKAYQITFSGCSSTGIQTHEDTDSHIDRWLLPAIIEAKFASERSTWLADCLSDSRVHSRKQARSSGISLSYDKSELGYNLSVNLSSPGRAAFLLQKFSKAHDIFEVDPEDISLKVLHRNTVLTKVDNQVFISTRLPRSDLDSLLAKKAQ